MIMIRDSRIQTPGYIPKSKPTKQLTIKRTHNAGVVLVSHATNKENQHSKSLLFISNYLTKMSLKI